MNQRGEMSDSESSAICRECGTNNAGKCVQCDKCYYWYHCKCAKLGNSVNKILNFFCEGCEGGEYITTWRRKPATEEQKRDKAKNFFDVIAVMAHRWTNGKREFKVRWANPANSPPTRVHDETWEAEKHLDGAIDLLQHYCRLHKLELSTIQA